jgi:tRNA threonylcarbamoyl adenosine modification protein (Sua5/YciO/YrdC/YwlC family)
VLEAGNKVPRLGGVRKKTVGIRVPDNQIPLSIVQELGNPIISTSLHHDDKILEYATDPELIYEKFRNLVDAVIDGGPGQNIPSTVIDCADDSFAVLRQGAGLIEEYV